MLGYHDSNRCIFDLWSPVDDPHECAIENRAFTAYTGSFELAARELARHPEAQNDEHLQDAICRRYGIFLDNITDDEAEMLSRMIEEYAR